MEEVIRVDNLVKKFRDLTAVNGVSFSVYKGEVFGILGPNGAGKTTTLEIIEGLLDPTSGYTMVLGLDTQRNPVAVKERIGVQLQASAYFDYLTLSEILELFGTFYKRRMPPKELLGLVGLLDKKNTTLRKLSGGQKQRFTVAASLVNDPEVVILDEPTAGLDPQARQNLWDLIRRIHAEGKTVVITTHYMEEAEALCDRVAIMDRGLLIALDTSLNLIRSLDAPYVVKMVTSKPLPKDDLEDSDWIVGDVISRNETSYEIKVKTAHAISKLVRWATESGVTMDHFEMVPATLEDVFLKLTGRELRD